MIPRVRVLWWHAADGRRLLGEDLREELPEIHAHRILTRLISSHYACLRVMARPGCASATPVR